MSWRYAASRVDIGSLNMFQLFEHHVAIHRRYRFAGNAISFELQPQTLV